MRQLIDPRDPLSLSYWCGHLSCTEFELMHAIRATGSREVGVVGLYLATRSTRSTRDQAEPESPAGSVCSVY